MQKEKFQTRGPFLEIKVPMNFPAGEASRKAAAGSKLPSGYSKKLGSFDMF